MVVLFLIFKGISIQFSAVAVSLCIPTSSARGFPFLQHLVLFLHEAAVDGRLAAPFLWHCSKSPLAMGRKLEKFPASSAFCLDRDLWISWAAATIGDPFLPHYLGCSQEKAFPLGLPKTKGSFLKDLYWALQGGKRINRDTAELPRSACVLGPEPYPKLLEAPGSWVSPVLVFVCMSLYF